MTSEGLPAGIWSALRSTAMKAKAIGHLTQSIYQRYSIVDESMLNEAAKKLEQLHALDQNSNGKAMAK